MNSSAVCPAREDPSIQPLRETALGTPKNVAPGGVRRPTQDNHDRYAHEDHKQAKSHDTPRDGTTELLRGVLSSSSIKPLRPNLDHGRRDELTMDFLPDEKMDHADPLEQTALPDEVVAKYRRIAKLQDQFFTAQTSLKTERDTAASILNRLIEARAQMPQLLEQDGRLSRRSSAAKRWKEANAQVLEHEGAFQAQMQHVNDMEQSLTKLEYKLAKLHPELLKVLQKYFNLGNDTGALDSSDTLSKSRGTSSDMHPLELEYYDKRGDARRLRDELIDHRAEFQTPPDEESTVPVPPTQVATEDSASYFQSAAFRAKWQQDHEALQQDLYDAEQELTRLWYACQEAGLSVGRLSIELSGPFEFREHESEQSPHDTGGMDIAAPPFLPQDDNGLVPQFLRNLRWPQQSITAPPLIGELNRFAKKKYDIEKWVAKVPMGRGPPSGFGADYNGLFEFDHEVHSDKDWAIVNKSRAEESSLKDYVLIPKERDHSAPNGEPENSEPGILQRVLRKWKSLDEMWETFRVNGKPVHRGSEDIRHGLVLPD